MFPSLTVFSMLHCLILGINSQEIASNEKTEQQSSTRVPPHNSLKGSILNLRSKRALESKHPRSKLASSNKWTNPLTIRIGLGPSISRATRWGYGGMATSDFEFWRWRAGELSTGLIFATHVLRLQRLREYDPGIEFAASDMALAVDANVGHHFLIWDDRLRLGTLVYSGLRSRIQRSQLRNQHQNLRFQHQVNSHFLEFGVVIRIETRFAMQRCTRNKKPWGLSLEIQLPLLSTGRIHPLQNVLLTPPYAGLMLTYRFKP